MTDCTTDSHGCVDCPAIDGVPAVPSQQLVDPRPGWNAGANSGEVLTDDNVHVVDTMPSVAGVVWGLKQSNRNIVISPGLIQYGFLFSRAGGADFVSIIENGVVIGTPILRTVLTDEYEIRRVRGAVTYRINGARIYTSARSSFGAIFVTCCLFTAGDSIQ